MAIFIRVILQPLLFVLVFAYVLPKTLAPLPIPLLAVQKIAAAGLQALIGGLLLGTLIDPQKIQVLFALVLLPMTMLGCVYYPWSALHSIRWLQFAVLANPLVYASEGLRATLTPQLPHMPVVAFLGVLAGGTVLLGWLACARSPLAC